MSFCYTEADRRRVRDYGVVSPIEVVPNGADTERVTPESPTSELIKHDGLVAIFVGRLVDGKRPQDAITAVRRAQREQPDLKLYLCGAGPLREELEDQAGEETEFLGHVPSDEMPAIYRSADVMVVPGRAEGVPRTVLEAITARVYSVTTALPPYEKIVKEGYGTTVPVENPMEMGRQIAAFLDLSGGIELGAGGSEYS
ncbi:glycosyltransferase family 4 protein [Halalkalicoccus salilacus]|uniref:glycosyltransferase family 4 protein n=1 Tax=Halalkalicoccus salilacus TaxID=3117459 RepID=UPI00300F6822